MHVPKGHIRTVALTFLCLMTAGLMVNVAAASADPVGVSGDWTCLTLEPGVNRALLAAGILVKPLDPGMVGSDWVDGKPTITFTFPITDGVIDPGTLAGSIRALRGPALPQHRQWRVAQGDGLQDRHRRPQAPGTRR